MYSAPTSQGAPSRGPSASPGAIGVQTSESGNSSEPLTPFSDYLINRSSVPLNRYFRKPESAPPSPHEALNDQLPRVGYRKLPRKLCTPAMLNIAENYYEENKSRREPSIYAVKVLIPLFLLPACVILPLRSAWLYFSSVCSAVIFRPSAYVYARSSAIRLWISFRYRTIMCAVLSIRSPSDMAMFADALSFVPQGSMHLS
jgi:hypothetical protein